MPEATAARQIGTDNSSQLVGLIVTAFSSYVPSRHCAFGAFHRAREILRIDNTEQRRAELFLSRVVFVKFQRRGCLTTIVSRLPGNATGDARKWDTVTALNDR
jgi:hypothetical protein